MERTTAGRVDTGSGAGAVGWWRELQATRWVLRLLAVQVALVCVVALQALLVLEPLAALVLLAAAVLVACLRHAFDLQHRWARDLLVVLAVLDTGWALAGATPWRAAVPALWLVLLLHPDAREWVRPDRGLLDPASTTRRRP